MKSTFSEKKEIIFLILIFVFSVTFVLSFIFPGRSISKNEKVFSSLINPKYVQGISAFELGYKEKPLYLFKKNGIWFCGEDEKLPKAFIPCLKGKVESFVHDFVTVRKMEKIVFKKSPLEHFGLDNENGFFVNYFNGNDYLEIIFGDSNFSETGRYLKGSDSSQIFLLTDKKLDKYLFANINQWADPFFISRNLGREYKENDIMNSDKNGLTELRHGGPSFYEPGPDEKTYRDLKILMGDTSSFYYQFYKIPQENGYHVNVIFENPLAEELKNINYSFKISEWTFEKIFGNENEF